jgi:hypothetical protein
MTESQGLRATVRLFLKITITHVSIASGIQSLDEGSHERAHYTVDRSTLNPNTPVYPRRNDFSRQIYFLFMIRVEVARQQKESTSICHLNELY